MSPTLPSPRIREMRPASCLALLRRHAVGWLAFSFHDRVDITPIHYVYSDGWLFARTSHGATGVFDWRSVVVRGAVYTLERDAGPTETKLWRRGIELLQRIVAGTGSDNDPVPFRTLVFGIHIDSMTGRMSSSAGGPRG